MTTLTYSSLLLSLYLVVLLVITYRNSTHDDGALFMIGNRSIGTIYTTASIVSGFRDGAGIVVWVLLAAYMGYGTMWLMVGVGIGFFALALSARKIVRDAHDYNFITQVGVYRNFYGPMTAKVATFILAAMSFLVSAAQLSIASTILVHIFGLSEVTSIIVIVGAVGVYLYFGGYNTVIKTDFLQWGLIFVIAIVLPFLLFGDGVTLSAPSFLSLDGTNKIGFAGISALIVYMSSDIWQRLFSSRSEQTGRNALLLSIPIYATISLGIVIFGIIAFGVLGDVDPSMMIQSMFVHTAMPALVTALVSVFVLVSVMSTMDTNTFLFAQFVARDTLRVSQGTEVQRTRTVLLVTIIALGVTAALVSNIITFLFGAFTIGTVLVPLLALYNWSHTKQAGNDVHFAIIVMIGSLVYIYLFATGAFENILMTLVPAAVSSVLVVGCVVYWKLRTRECYTFSNEN